MAEWNDYQNSEIESKIEIQEKIEKQCGQDCANSKGLKKKKNHQNLLKETTNQDIQISSKNQYSKNKNWNEKMIQEMFKLVSKKQKWKKISKNILFENLQICNKQIKIKFEILMRKKLNILFRQVYPKQDYPKKKCYDLSDKTYRQILMPDLQMVCQSTSLFTKQQLKNLIYSQHFFSALVDETQVRTNIHKKDVLSKLSKDADPQIILNALLILNSLFVKEKKKTNKIDLKSNNTNITHISTGIIDGKRSSIQQQYNQSHEISEINEINKLLQKEPLDDCTIPWTTQFGLNPEEQIFKGNIFPPTYDE